MLITKTYDWSRRDFSYDTKCENPECGNIAKHTGGYDDDNYYNNVIPNAKCTKCGKSSVDLSTKTDDITPRHDPHTII